MRECGSAYVTGFISAPHDLEQGRFVSALHEDTDEVIKYAGTWGSQYGNGVAAGSGVLCLCAYRIIGDECLKAYAEAVGVHNARNNLPEGVNVPAKDAGMTLEIFADLYDLTGERTWRDQGLELAERLLPIYFDQILPRGASGIQIYESQLLPGYLVHSLARLALLARDREQCVLNGDYTLR